MPAAPPRWAAPLAAAVACTAFSLWDPPLRDLAAHTFRADYFEQFGFAIWNNSWYGGHYMLSYSVLFPPLAALLSPVWAAAVPAVVSASLFDRIVRERWGETAGWAGLWFGALGAVALLANGWLVFALGLAFALGALRALQHGRAALAAVCAVAAALASPVAAAFLALVCVIGALYATPRGPLLVTVAAALVPLALLGLAFPESGAFPFWFSAWWPLALFCVLALAATARHRARSRGARGDRRLPGARDALRPFAESARREHDPPRLAVRRAGAPRRAAGPPAARPCAGGSGRAGRGARLAGDHTGPADLREPRRSGHRACLLRAARALLAAAGAQRERIEIPQTFNHWETAYVSPRFALARGWLRQLDLERNEIFYEGEPTHASYRRWLADEGDPLGRGVGRAPGLLGAGRGRARARRAAVPAPPRPAAPLAHIRGGRQHRAGHAARPRSGADGDACAGVVHAGRYAPGLVRRANAPHALLDRESAAPAWAGRATGRSCALRDPASSGCASASPAAAPGRPRAAGMTRVERESRDGQAPNVTF